ncbi:MULTISPECIES: hypothetical protein [Nitrospirillum]|uniref:Uncharacterized protein n=1 Tax=Nitrospirillum amazonense TaxID=28077 RepID=A0A560GA66_9PROT|nr:hypothetical protein [Nitrospirillum amazonense]MEC4591310.1 hypothetical protein [Nitrospirillum amazonense]TWB30701.1 hypothetical protein FBZ88_102266 [Nitrospirillum amazonense]
MIAGAVRRWMVALALGGLAAVPRVAHAGAGLGLEMVCADAVNAAPVVDRLPPFARMLGLMPAHPAPVPTAACAAGYQALWTPKSAPVPETPVGAETPPGTILGPQAFDGLAGARDLGLYTHYAGALLAGLPADLAARGDRMRTAAVTRLIIIGQSLAASAYRPVAALHRAYRDPTEPSPVRMARLLRPEVDTQSP